MVIELEDQTIWCDKCHGWGRTAPAPGGEICTHCDGEGVLGVEAVEIKDGVETGR